MSKLACVCLIVAVSAGAAWGQNMNIQQALDQPVELNISSAPIGDVFAKLEQSTGVDFAISEDAMAALPYGDQTRLAVTLKNVTLRKALSPMLTPQGLQWQIEGDTVKIVPADALYRMSRRATYEELRLLGAILSVKLQEVATGGEVIDQLRAAAGAPELRLVFETEDDRDGVIERANRVLPATGAQWLDAVGQNRQWTWYLRGDDIVVLPRAVQVRRQLQKQVSLRYQNAKLVTVLHDLTRKGKVALTMDPDVMNYLPTETRENFNLMMADASIAQAMEVISGVTGLAFIHTDEGVRVEASDALKRRTGAADQQRQRSPFFVRMSMPGPEGTSVEVYLRADELPDDVVEKILAEKAKLIKQYRKPPVDMSVIDE